MQSVYEQLEHKIKPGTTTAGTVKGATAYWKQFLYILLAILTKNKEHQYILLLCCVLI